MIFPLGGLVIGAILGAITARMRGGNRADMAQWAGVWGMALGVIGMFIVIWIDRQM